MDSFTVAELIGESPSSILDSAERSVANKVAELSEAQTCTYEQGYITQPVFMCRTCLDIRKKRINQEAEEDSDRQPSEQAAYFGFCLACSLNCHVDHDVVELGDRARFRCDCGNARCPTSAEVNQAKFESAKSLGLFNCNETDTSHAEVSESLLKDHCHESICTLAPKKEMYNSKNIYNHNFEGVFCRCRKPYDPSRPMRGCAVCHDYFHDDCIHLMPNSFSPEVLPPRIASLLAFASSGGDGVGNGSIVKMSIADEDSLLWSELDLKEEPMDVSLLDKAVEHVTLYFDQISKALSDAEANVFVCGQCAAKCPSITNYSLSHPMSLKESISTCSRIALERAVQLKRDFTDSSGCDSSFKLDNSCCIIGNDAKYHCQLIGTCLTCPEIDLDLLGACQSCKNTAEIASKDHNQGDSESDPSPKARDICVACAFTCHYGHNIVNWRIEGAAICDCSLDGKQKCAFEGDRRSYSNIEMQKCFKPQGDGNFVLSKLEGGMGESILIPKGSSSSDTQVYDFAMCLGWKHRFCRCAECKKEIEEQGYAHAVEDNEVSVVTLKIKELESLESEQGGFDSFEQKKPDSSNEQIGQKRSENPTVSQMSGQVDITQVVKRIAPTPSNILGIAETEEASFVDYWSNALPYMLASELKACVGDSGVVTKEMMESAISRVKQHYTEAIETQREQFESISESERFYEP